MVSILKPVRPLLPGEPTTTPRPPIWPNPSRPVTLPKF
jgi:hypothetical protein